MHLRLDIELDTDHQPGVFEVAFFVRCAFEEVTCNPSIIKSEPSSIGIWVYIRTSRLRQIIRSGWVRERGECASGSTGIDICVGGFSTAPGLAIVVGVGWVVGCCRGDGGLVGSRKLVLMRLGLTDYWSWEMGGLTLLTPLGLGLGLGL